MRRARWITAWITGLPLIWGSACRPGSANVGSFAAGQSRRNYRFYTEFGLRKEYAGLGNFLKKRSFLDLDYVYSTLSNSENKTVAGCYRFIMHPASSRSIWQN